MLFQHIQQPEVVFLCHLAAVLFPMPGTQDIRRVTVDQDIRRIKPGYQLFRRGAFNLDTPQPFRRINDDLWQVAPCFRCIGPFSASNIPFPSDPLTCGAETVPHIAADEQPGSLFKAVFREIGGIGTVIDLQLYGVKYT